MHLCITRKEACDAIEQGYRDALAAGGRAFVLAEHHRWLRQLALNKLRDPVVFWEKILACPRYKGKLPKDVWKLVHASLPLRTYNFEMKSRIAGLGSLGHPRVLALATWDGAHIVREAKQLTPSAWIWARKLHTTQILSRKLVESAVRLRDPHVHFADHWIVRRLAPDCCHIEIGSLPGERDEEKLLYYMGWETQTFILAARKVLPAVRRDLARRKGRWLHKAAKAMLEVTLDDWKDWGRKKGRGRVVSDLPSRKLRREGDWGAGEKRVAGDPCPCSVVRREEEPGSIGVGGVLLITIELLPPPPVFVSAENTGDKVFCFLSDCK